jgi:hypothetical protein
MALLSASITEWLKEFVATTIQVFAGAGLQDAPFE